MPFFFFRVSFEREYERRTEIFRKIRATEKHVFIYSSYDASVALVL